MKQTRKKKTNMVLGCKPWNCRVFDETLRQLPEAKIAEMKCYESEARKFSQPCSPEALRALATRRESVVGCSAAEAFELVRSVGLQPN